MALSKESKTAIKSRMNEVKRLQEPVVKRIKFLQGEIAKFQKDLDSAQATYNDFEKNIEEMNTDIKDVKTADLSDISPE